MLDLAEGGYDRMPPQSVSTAVTTVGRFAKTAALEEAGGPPGEVLRVPTGVSGREDLAAESAPKGYRHHRQEDPAECRFGGTKAIGKSRYGHLAFPWPSRAPE